MQSINAFDALGSPVRRDILMKLHASSLTVGDLAAYYPVSRPAISRHLRILEGAGLVECRTVGTHSYYTVRLQGFVTVRAFLDQFWDAALARLEELAKE